MYISWSLSFRFQQQNLLLNYDLREPGKRTAPKLCFIPNLGQYSLYIVTFSDYSMAKAKKRKWFLARIFFIYFLYISATTIEHEVQVKTLFVTYLISSYSFRRNCSFFNLEIVENSNSCRNISIFYLINWYFTAETIQGRKLYEEIWYFLDYSCWTCVCFIERSFHQDNCHNSCWSNYSTWQR